MCYLVQKYDEYVSYAAFLLGALALPDWVPSPAPVHRGHDATVP